METVGQENSSNFLPSTCVSGVCSAILSSEFVDQLMCSLFHVTITFIAGITNSSTLCCVYSRQLGI